MCCSGCGQPNCNYACGTMDEEYECPECHGEGSFDESDCCGAELLGEEEYICADCKEHCSRNECPECEGTGIICVRPSPFKKKQRDPDADYGY